MVTNNAFNRDTKYWNTFYKNNPPKSMNESLFAHFASKYIEKDKSLVDIGCGNGRDSIYFNNMGLNVIGIDASDTAIKELNSLSSDTLSFICDNFINSSKIYNQKIDYYYSRFTIHAIDETSEDELLQNVYNSLSLNGMFFIEVRSIHDAKYGLGTQVSRNAYLLDNHYRRFIVMEEMLTKLINLGFSIKYAEEAKGFAPYKDEDSEIIRIITVKR